MYRLAGAPDGYAFVWPSDTQVWAQELVCAPETELGFVAALMERFNRPACHVTGLGFSNRQPLGCVLRHDGARPAGWLYESYAELKEMRAWYTYSWQTALKKWKH